MQISSVPFRFYDLSWGMYNDVGADIPVLAPWITMVGGGRRKSPRKLPQIGEVYLLINPYIYLIYLIY
jgi:hypothetical protein